MRRFLEPFWKTSSPLRTLVAILGVASAVTGLYVSNVGSAGHFFNPAQAYQSVVESTAAPLLNHAGILTPAVDPTLTQKAQHVADKSFVVADKTLDTVDITVETGERIVRFGAGVVDQFLPASPSAPPNPDFP